MAKYVFVTGGVLSSLGKGLAAASIGALLEARGLSVTFLKLDPYINVDPGTMSPFQHGEVYVTDDGAETDLDLGHYERYTSARMGAINNTTAGKIYFSVITKERQGEYLGRTVQVIPHITDEIKSQLYALQHAADIVICEIGGTVGDIESLPFLEAIRQFKFDVGRDNVVYVHVTLVPLVKGSDELKTKPTQHSVRALREIGIDPDVILCRTDRILAADIKSKIALFCNVEQRAVITAKDVDVVYEVPLFIHEEGLDDILLERLRVAAPPPDLSDWAHIVERIAHPSQQTQIAIVGKYVGLKDSYKSLVEAMTHGGIANDTAVELRWVESEDVQREGPERLLADVSGILIPGGFGERGIEGKIRAVRYARERKVPFFGICLGLHCAIIEAARNRAGLDGATSTEFDQRTPHPVICLMEEWIDYKEKTVQRRSAMSARGGTMRLGSYPCQLREDSLAYLCYGKSLIHERHRHRYEVNPAYVPALTKAGLVMSGQSPDGRLVEVIELGDHPWFLAVQFHPEFQSSPRRPHPLFRAFINASLKASRA